MSHTDHMHLVPLNERIELFNACGKPPTTAEEQISILKDRGMVIPDNGMAVKLLSDIGYYRLMGYSFLFKENDQYHKNFSIDTAAGLYELDNQLRSWLFSLIGRFEIKLKSQFAYALAHRHGALAHLDSKI